MTNLPVTTPEVKVNWNELKGKLKAKFPTLTDADLMFEEGKRDEMLKKVQERLGKSKEEVEVLLTTI
jgi:uncharacterized protein YjbJ (UPF0337 family)